MASKMSLARNVGILNSSDARRITFMNRIMDLVSISRGTWDPVTHGRILSRMMCVTCICDYIWINGIHNAVINVLEIIALLFKLLHTY